MQLFDRVIELQIGDTEIKGLHIAFEVEKSLSPEPNMAQIIIWNLCERNRRTLSEQTRIPVILKAGHKNNVALLFRGDLLSCDHIKEGMDYVFATDFRRAF